MPGGTHGIAISHATGQGFTDDGENGQAVAFDLKTLKVVSQDPGRQGRRCDHARSGHRPRLRHQRRFRHDHGGRPEDRQGGRQPQGRREAGIRRLRRQGLRLCERREDKRELLKIDARTNQIVARWPTPDCESPHGLAVDAAGHRAFMGCLNSVMMVVDTETGRLVAKLADRQGQRRGGLGRQAQAGVQLQRQGRDPQRLPAGLAGPLRRAGARSRPRSAPAPWTWTRRPAACSSPPPR